MATNVISSKDIYNIICKTLAIVDGKVMNHGEITGYILYKMLQTDGSYTKQDLMDYTMIGLIHDIGIMKTGRKGGFINVETKDVWAHSIYGYLFVKYLSPFQDKADLILYHHLPYNKHSAISNPHFTIIEALTLADRMDLYMRFKGHEMDENYFKKNEGIYYSSKALELFNKAEAKYHITNKLITGEYKEELAELLSGAHFNEDYKRKMLQMLIYTIDFRSEVTVVHTLATTTFAMSISRLMRIPYEDSQCLYYGALLHDIGKIAIPLSILEAPRRLNDEEMRIMKAHVIITKQMLEGIIDEKVLEIAARHHEKLDGSGYPLGLTKENLTLPQRIVAVADIISALYGKRSYKEGFSSSQIAQILEEDASAGKLDANVVKMTVRSLNTIINDFEKSKNIVLGTYMTIQKQYEVIYEKFKEYE